MRSHILSVLGYVVATFVTQGTSHFAIFTRHYAAVTYIKPEPVFALGIASMLIQGTILSFVFTGSRFAARSLMDAILFAWLFGAFLVSYIALGEAGKYSVPSVSSWIVVEFGVGFVQFTLVGIALGLAHRVSNKR
jgi:hypothetical protein